MTELIIEAFIFNQRIERDNNLCMFKSNTVLIFQDKTQNVTNIYMQFTNKYYLCKKTKYLCRQNQLFFSLH